MSSEKYGIGYDAVRADYESWVEEAYFHLKDIEHEGSPEEIEAARIVWKCREEAKRHWEEEWDAGNDLGFDWHHDSFERAALEKLYPKSILDERKHTIYVDKSFDHSCGIVAPCFSTVNDELILYLSNHPDFLQQLNWRTFETLLADIFKNQGFDVELGPGRGDSGVDIRLIHKDSIGKLLTIVQVKRYRQQYKIRLEAVAALAAIVDANQAHRGLFVTTSEFLPSARQFAAKNAHRLELACSIEVVGWLKQYKSNNQLLGMRKI